MKRWFGGLLLLILVASGFWWMFHRDESPMRPSDAASAAVVPSPVKPGFRKAGAAKAREAPVPMVSPAQVEAVTAAVMSAVRQKPVRIEAPPSPPVQVPADYPASIQQGPEHQEAEEIALNIRNFSQRFGGNPVGSNAEIVQALRGGNPGKANYMPQSAMRLNGNGELIDKWGRPYFFHANSATVMEIRSAGPDGRLFTPDDIVTK
jgi:hypothetical protein